MLTIIQDYFLANTRHLNDLNSYEYEDADPCVGAAFNIAGSILILIMVGMLSGAIFQTILLSYLKLFFKTAENATELSQRAPPIIGHLMIIVYLAVMLPAILTLLIAYLIKVLHEKYHRVEFDKGNMKQLDMQSTAITTQIERLGLNDTVDALSPPSEFICPITLELLRKPVINVAGHTYELHAVSKWYENNLCDPKTNAALDPSETKLFPNKSIEAQILDYLTTQAAQQESASSTEDVETQRRYLLLP